MKEEELDTDGDTDGDTNADDGVTVGEPLRWL
jgi:hypothetical protein